MAETLVPTIKITVSQPHLHIDGTVDGYPTQTAIITFGHWFKGDKGDDGESAYEIWLDEGHTGTEEDFLDWLKAEGAYIVNFEYQNNEIICENDISEISEAIIERRHIVGMYGGYVSGQSGKLRITDNIYVNYGVNGDFNEMLFDFFTISGRNYGRLIILLSSDGACTSESYNYFSGLEREKLRGIESGAQRNVQSDWVEDDPESDAYILHKPEIPSVNDGTLTIQKNGSQIGSFSANTDKDEIINIKVPTSAADVNALPASTAYGSSLSLTMNSSTYVLTARLKDQNGNNLGQAQTVDLPLEAVVLYTQQTLTSEQQAQARANIGAGSSGFSGDYGDLTSKPVLNTNNSTAQTASANETINGTINLHKVSKTGNYNDLSNLPTLGTAAALDVAASGNASSTQVVKGDDTRLTDSRPASDVPQWAKETNKPTYTASEVGAIPTTQKGANGGVAELDSTGKVPSSQLPSYVDDVLEYASQSAFPATGESGKIYIALDTNKTYRWGGSAYTEISESLALGETSSTAYAGNKGKANADAIAAIKDGSIIDSFADVEAALTSKQDTINSNNKLSADLIEDGNNNKVFTSSEKTKLGGIESGAQVNVKPDWNATSGSASEILNKPTIPAAQVNADWNASSGIAQILNKPILATVATSGNYNDLSNTPTIPDAVSGTNDGTNWTSLTIGSVTKAIPSGGGGSSTQYAAVLRTWTNS